MARRSSVTDSEKSRLVGLGIWRIWTEHRSFARESKLKIPSAGTYTPRDAWNFGTTVLGGLRNGVAKGEFKALKERWPDGPPAEVGSEVLPVEGASGLGDTDAGPLLGDLKVPKRGSVDLGDLPKRKCAWRRSVEWVLDNLGRRGVDPEECPSWSAWQMLQDYGGTETLRREFMSQFGSKLLPTRSQIELEGKMSDNGRDLQDTTLALLESFKGDSVLPECSEGGAGESVVPAEDVGVGSEESSELGGSVDNGEA